MKRLMVLALVVTILLTLAGIASAEHGNIGGIGATITGSSTGRHLR